MAAGRFLWVAAAHMLRNWIDRTEGQARRRRREPKDRFEVRRPHCGKESERGGGAASPRCP